jgi:hypothetical protein
MHMQDIKLLPAEAAASCKQELPCAALCIAINIYINLYHTHLPSRINTVACSAINCGRALFAACCSS